VLHQLPEFSIHIRDFFTKINIYFYKPKFTFTDVIERLFGAALQMSRAGFGDIMSNN
jgi:hypothetical protein